MIISIYRKLFFSTKKWYYSIFFEYSKYITCLLISQRIYQKHCLENAMKFQEIGLMPNTPGLGFPQKSLPKNGKIDKRKILE